jgi:hypothetical protein
MDIQAKLIVIAATMLDANIVCMNVIASVVTRNDQSSTPDWQIVMYGIILLILIISAVS